jgi:nucleoside-diphosphate-sugar epimerase
VQENVLIAGCGYTGIALGLRLVQDGCKVWGLRRNTAALPPEIQPLALDLNRDPIPAFPVSFDAVFYTAGSDAFSEPAYRAAYVDGPRRLLEALQAQGQTPRRILYTSSTGVYAQQDGTVLDEESPADSPRFSGAVIREGEEVWNASPYASVVVRFAGIYGPGRTRLIESVRNGTAECVADPPAWVNLIHRDDCAGVLRHLLRVPDPAPLYIGVDDEPLERCALLQWIADQLGVPGPAIVPPPPGPIDPQRGGNRRYSNARLRATGYTFQYPSFRDAFPRLR